MPYCITVAGDIQQCFPDFATARSDIQELRNQGQKPRLYYSTSFAHLGCEIDDNGVRIPHEHAVVRLRQAASSLRLILVNHG